jgi:hypothetical protein
VSGWLVALTAVVTVLTVVLLVTRELVREKRGVGRESPRWAAASWVVLVLFVVLTGVRLSSGA